MDTTPNIQNPKDIVEKIMTQHWDIAACQCWICKHGREMGLRPRKKHMIHHGGDKLPLVYVMASYDEETRGLA